MFALLRQPGLVKILDAKTPSTSTKDEGAELEEKTQNVILLFLSNRVLREIVDEETTGKL